MHFENLWEPDMSDSRMPGQIELGCVNYPGKFLVNVTTITACQLACCIALLIFQIIQ